jgi:hypothetical protein
MRRYLIFGIILSGLFFGAWAQEVNLAAERDLQKPIRVWLKMTPLRDVLREISQQTGVSLRCQDAIQHEKVAIFVEQRPAHEVLTQLAKTLRYAWRKREGGGYMLYVPDETRLFQERLSRAEQEFKRKQLQRAAQLARELVKLTPEQVRSEMSLLYALAEKEPLTAEQQLRFELLNALLPREDDVGDGVERYDYNSGFAAVHCLAKLSEAAIRALSRGEAVGFSSRPAKGAYPLPAGALFPGYMRDTTPVQVRLRNEQGEEEETYIQVPVPNNPDYCGVWLRLSPSESRLEYALYSWSARIQSTTGDINLGSLAQVEHPYLRIWREWATPLEQLSKRLPDQARLVNPENPELTFPQYRWNPLQGVQTRLFGKITCADALEWLAFTRRLPVIADAYRTASVILGVNELQHQPTLVLRALDERMWLRMDESGYLLGRVKSYWLLRRYELPEDWIRPLEQKYARQGYLDWMDYIDLAGKLNETQARYYNRRYVVFYDQPLTLFDWTPMERSLPALRFLASLPKPLLERALVSREWLRVELLPPLAQRRFQEAIADTFPSPERLIPPDAPLPEAEPVRTFGELWGASEREPIDPDTPEGVLAFRLQELQTRYLALESAGGSVQTYMEDDTPQGAAFTVPEILKQEMEQHPGSQLRRVQVRELRVVLVAPKHITIYSLEQPRIETIEAESKRQVQ